MSTNTTIFLRKSAAHVRLYTPMVSRGFLFGLLQLGIFVLAELHHWKEMIQQGVTVTPLDVTILRWGAGVAFVGAWFSYTDKTKARFDEKLNESKTVPPHAQVLG